MSRNIFKRVFAIAVSFSLLGRTADPKLVKPMSQLFSHKAHQAIFEKSSLSCVDCHSFSVKPRNMDPLGVPVPAGYLSPSRARCHECHLGQVSFPRPNQCVLCHKDILTLKPDDHFLSWSSRHGRMAQMDSTSCTKCHSKSSCSDCHTQKSISRPVVHPPNFRMFHSIQARANPQSCVSCHSTQNTCVNCHSNGGGL